MSLENPGPVDLAETEMTALALEAAEQAMKQDSLATLRLLNIQPLMPMALLDYIPPNFDSKSCVRMRKKNWLISPGS